MNSNELPPPIQITKGKEPIMPVAYDPSDILPPSNTAPSAHPPPPAMSLQDMHGTPIAPQMPGGGGGGGDAGAYESPLYPAQHSSSMMMGGGGGPGIGPGHGGLGHQFGGQQPPPPAPPAWTYDPRSAQMYSASLGAQHARPPPSWLASAFQSNRTALVIFCIALLVLTFVIPRLPGLWSRLGAATYVEGIPAPLSSLGRIAAALVVAASFKTAEIVGVVDC